MQGCHKLCDIDPKLVPEVMSILNFIHRHYPESLEWEDPVGYAGWYITHGFVGTVLNDKNEIRALVTMRPVAKPELGAIPYHYDKDGDCLWIDLLIVDDYPLAKKGLALLFLNRFG